jgi:hypothetical protein
MLQVRKFTRDHIKQPDSAGRIRNTSYYYWYSSLDWTDSAAAGCKLPLH